MTPVFGNYLEKYLKQLVYVETARILEAKEKTCRECISFEGRESMPSWAFLHYFFILTKTLHVKNIWIINMDNQEI